MGSQFLMGILKDSGVADIAVSVVDYLVGKIDKDRSEDRKSGIRARDSLS